jgi:hypothetical protein
MSVNPYGSSWRKPAPPSRLRRWKVPGTIAIGTLAVLGAGLGTLALADTNEAAAASSIVCPDVASELPAIPARAQAEVDRNLALLNTQIAEANRRLATSVGQGGANFVQNAILGPLKDKRASTIDRIVISIGRAGAKPTGLDSLATCSLSNAAAPAEPPAEAAPAEPAPAAPPADASADGGATAGGILCPAVADQLPAIPAQAAAEVARNLTLLETQISEANNRLATSVGQGGANFVQNAILGPLEDKRLATINRIATAIGRNADKPVGLQVLAPCELNE